jgi:hypothetical protein
MLIGKRSCPVSTFRLGQPRWLEDDGITAKRPRQRNCFIHDRRAHGRNGAIGEARFGPR